MQNSLMQNQEDMAKLFNYIALLESRLHRYSPAPKQSTTSIPPLPLNPKRRVRSTAAIPKKSARPTKKARVDDVPDPESPVAEEGSSPEVAEDGDAPSPENEEAIQESNAADIPSSPPGESPSEDPNQASNKQIRFIQYRPPRGVKQPAKHETAIVNSSPTPVEDPTPTNANLNIDPNANVSPQTTMPDLGISWAGMIAQALKALGGVGTHREIADQIRELFPKVRAYKNLSNTISSILSISGRFHKTSAVTLEGSHRTTFMWSIIPGEEEQIPTPKPKPVSVSHQPRTARKEK